MNVNEEYFKTHNVEYEDDKYRTLIGLKFGKLTVKHAYHMNQGTLSRLILVCECECGKLTHQRIESLKDGSTVSCGCSHHGLSRTRLYYVWRNIRNRCYRKSCHSFKWYGARGITMCEEWKNDPLAFIQWSLANGYRKGLQLDRRDNDKGYSPANCHFVTAKENARNRSVTVKLTLDGETKPLTEWSEILKISASCLLERIRKGMSDAEALLTPVDKVQQRRRRKDENGRLVGKMLTYQGERKTVSEWASLFGIHEQTIHGRIRLGWDVDKTLSTPVRKMVTK